mgnify:CR=1 FL=1
MTVLEILLPLVAVVLLTLPLIKVFTGKVSAQSAKRRLGVHISGFAGAVVLCLLVAMSNSVYLQQVKLLQSLVQLLKV